MKGKEYGMNKIASVGAAGAQTATFSQKMKDFATNPKTVMGAGAMAGMGLQKMIRKIRNDNRRKTLIEELMRHDPILKDAEKEEVMRYYATLYNIAPELSLDKNAVKELLQNFIKFGRVDMATLKMLADTEKSLKSQGQGAGMRIKDFI